MLRKLHILVALSMFIITISSVYVWSNLPLKNTTIWWLIYTLIVVLLFKSKILAFHKFNKDVFLFFTLFIVWNIVCVLRGLFEARDYWEWKSLVGTTLILFVPFVIYTATNVFMVQKMVFLWIKYSLPIFFILAPLIHTGAFGRYLFPVSFIVLFFPILPKQWKTYSILLIVLVIVVGISSRSNIIKFTIPLFCSFLYYVNHSFAEKIIKVGRNSFLIMPALFLILGVTQIFNVFKMSEYIEGDYSFEAKGAAKTAGDFRDDTRTGLYEEVLYSALKYDYIWFGRTPARGNESQIFGPGIDKATGMKKMERYRNEAAILNVFTWTGLVGLILYFLVFLKASSLAINESNNLFIKIIGLYVSFRWLYAWVEDFREFDLSTFFLWICLGMCYSKSFRLLNDKEMYLWVQGFFNQNFRSLFVQWQLQENTKELNKKIKE